MENLVFTNLVGRRDVKGEGEAVVIAEVTKGNFRLSNEISNQLGITDGSFVIVQHEATTGKVFIGKGKDGEALKDEAGNYIVDPRGHRQYNKGQEGFGALAREITPGTGVIRVAVSSAWQEVGGSTEEKKVFTLGEGVDVNLPTGNGTFSTTLYPLEFLRTEPKLERVGSKSSPKATIDTSDDEEGFVAEEL